MHLGVDDDHFTTLAPSATHAPGTAVAALRRINAAQDSSGESSIERTTLTEKE